MKKIILFALLLPLGSFAQYWNEVGGYLGSYLFDPFANNAMIQDMVVHPNGTLYFTGKDSVLQWSGGTWSYVGSNAGIPTPYLAGSSLIYAMALDNVGNLYVAGDFVNSFGKHFVAKWDGTTWTELGGNNGLSANDKINAIYIDQNNNVYAGGKFKNAQGMVYVAKYNGTSWSSLGTSFALTDNNLDYINSIAVGSNGYVYVGGSFANNSSNTYIPYFNGTSWLELGGSNSFSSAYGSSNWGGEVNSLLVTPNGDLHAGGNFTNNSNNRFVAKYNGTGWSELGGANSLGSIGNFSGSLNFISDMIFTNGHYFVVGNFASTGASRFVAHYDGTSWSELGPDGSLLADDWIKSVAVYNTTIYVAGNFGHDIFAGDVNARFIESADYTTVVTEGCMDSLACNYDPIAMINTGCLYMDSTCNDNVDNTINDIITDSCICAGTWLEPGCMDSLACNFNPLAQFENGSCIHIGDGCDDSNEFTTNDVINESCECMGTLPQVSGCMDSLACNYNPNATVPLDSCTYPGSPCDDSNPLTWNDSLDVNCNCQGITDNIVNAAWNNSLMLFPNPASTSVSIHTSSTHPVMELFDAVGHRLNVNFQYTDKSVVLDTSMLEPGLYQVKVRGTNLTQTLVIIH